MAERSENYSPVSLLDDFRETLLDELRELVPTLQGGFDGLEYTLLFPPQELADDDTTLDQLKLNEDDDVVLIFNGDMEVLAEALAADDLAGLKEALEELAGDESEETAGDQQE